MFIVIMCVRNVNARNVCSDNVVCEKSDGAVCTKFVVEIYLSNKCICNHVFNKLSNNKMHVFCEKWFNTFP